MKLLIKLQKIAKTLQQSNSESVTNEHDKEITKNCQIPNLIN